MTRWLLLAVYVLIAPSSLWATERLVSARRSDSDDQARWRTGLEFASESEPASHATAADNNSFLITPATWDPTVAHAVSAEQAEEAAKASDPGYAADECWYPMCEHRCLIECMDCWCISECETCCTTDEWCDHPCQCSQGNSYVDECGNWYSNDHWCDVWGDPTTSYDSGLRLGWWGVSTEGSTNKTGEFQDLESSPFWDVDVISSNGERTLDLIMSGLDNEANDARWNYYSRGLTAKGRYNRFLRRLDHDPLQGADISGPLGPNDNVVTQDLNVGEDYAIRVEQLDARFQGRITDNVKWRLNLWGQRKFGERQVNATAHCFDVDPGPAANNVCHVLSQRQNIDWLTMEIQPVVEARFENTTVEYSRTMRGFGQDDQAMSRTYTRFAPFNTGAPFEYAFVPENFTQIDRLKVNSFLTDTDQLYANMYLGDTENKFRDTHREFGGFDVRWMNHTFADMTVTTYTSMYDENNQLPTSFRPEETGSVRAAMRHPVDHTRTRAGIKGNWFPNGYSDNSMIWVGGYEYFLHTRDYSVYDTALGGFIQPDTKMHQVELGPNKRWSESIYTFSRYKVRFIEDPLIGVRESNGRFNTNQPEQEHRIELGGNWTPAANFMTTAQFSIVNRWHQSQFADFNEDDYPFTYTVWYAPSDRLSLTGGYGYYSNWIDQDITLGFRFNAPTDQTETTRWSYSGENHLLSLNAAYAWTPRVSVIAGYEWDRGRNVFFVPPSPAGADWSLLPSLSDVEVTTQRWTAGIDWQAFGDMYVFSRYNLFDYQDDSGNPVSGVAHMALGGVSWYR